MIFGAVERMIAFRYLRARRQEGFVSVIAIFSLLGIALGVATLIIVMSVMNGFRADLLARILGLNGDLGVYAAAGPLGGFDAAARRVEDVPGVTAVIPVVEGQVMATTAFGASGALVRGIRPADLRALRLVSGHIVAGSLDDFGDDGIAVGDRLARQAIMCGRKFDCDSAEGRLICDEIAPVDRMDDALATIVEGLTGSGLVSAVGNRCQIRIGQEPLDLFRGYLARYAREQAACHFSSGLIANLERHWNAQSR